MRTKHVHADSMVAHLWANQSQADARTKHGNFFFEGDTIYSYGRHFPIARHATDSKGKPVILFTTRRYSVTTRKHISIVRQALPAAATVIPCRDPDRTHDHGPNLDDYRERMASASTSSLTAKSRKGDYLKTVIKNITDFRRYAKAFGLPDKITPPKGMKQARDLAATYAAAQQARNVTREANREANRRARDTAYRKQQEERDTYRAKGPAAILADWQGRTAPDYIGHADITDCSQTVRLRLSKDGNTVQTSLGAEVPADHARRLWPILLKLRGSSRDLTAAPLRVGDFKIEKIAADGITAGCHFISWQALENFVPILFANGPDNAGCGIQAPATADATA